MCNSPVLFRTSKFSDVIYKRPCGQCLGCRVDSMLIWSNRMQYDLIGKPSAFVTFTYDSLHLRYSPQNSVLPSLCKDEFTHYLSNIRHQLKNKFGLDKFSYFSVGEYGDIFNRPHYHSIFAGVDFHDFSDFFKKSWKCGIVKSLPCLPSAVRYVVNYMLKNITGDMAIELYDKQGLERPFKSVTRGLGFEFFLAHADEIRQTGMIKIGNRHCCIPSYYKNIFCDFTDSQISSRFKFKVDSYKRLSFLARSAHFDSVDEYLKYKRVSCEKSLITKYRNESYPYNCRFYSHLGDFSDSHVLADNFV